jgi:hypothetical protein
MTRKHFIAIAEAVRNVSLTGHGGEPYETELLRDVAESLANALAQFNSGFDRQRFLDACLRGERE